MIPWSRHPAALKLIIGYKFTKAPLALALALWLTVAPHTTYDLVEAFARMLAAGGALWARVGTAIQGELTQDFITGGAVLAWLDGVSTAVEGGLLLSGKAWAEWIVIAELGCLIPVGLVYLVLHPGPGKVLAVLLNVVIVLYLARKRLRADGVPASPGKA